MPNKSYLNFLTATEKVWADISPNGRKILVLVIKRGSTDPFKVRDVIGMRSIASQATLHKCLGELIASGHITLKADPSDGRVKYVTLSKKGNLLVDKLSKLLAKAIP